ncbi:MAG: hypothetical protein DMF91_23495 [Acidobacteria bacterium]|nr:MAG: hypothetical protein DMF91_23495 [Acidobacteriota bacterium]
MIDRGLTRRSSSVTGVRTMRRWSDAAWRNPSRACITAGCFSRHGDGSAISDADCVSASISCRAATDTAVQDHAM